MVFIALLTLTTIFPPSTDIICTFVHYLQRKMTENRNYLQKYAMQFGTYMGVYWILKFILFPLAMRIPFLSILFIILTLAMPFIGYYYAKMYRDKICRGNLEFSHSVLFTMSMYMFASLLLAMAYYIYFQFIDHGTTINAITEKLRKLIQPNRNEEIINRIIDSLNARTPIHIAMQQLFLNVIW